MHKIYLFLPGLKRTSAFKRVNSALFKPSCTSLKTTSLSFPMLWRALSRCSLGVFCISSATRGANSCYYSWAHGTAVLVTERAKARLSGQHFTGIQAPYEKNSRKIIIIMSSSPDFEFFSQEETLQLLSGNCPRHLTKSRLRTWFSYRVGTANNGSASSDANKRELMHRWVSSGMYDRSSCPIFVQE